MNDETKQLIEELKVYRNDMVARNYPFQKISDIITKWEHKKDFYEETQKEKQELEESYKESVRQTKERKHFHARAIDGYGE
jgi:diadenosine tetraphosphate (Ap4A) HIT family hydrolase